MKKLISSGKLFVAISIAIIIILSVTVSRQFKKECFKQCICQSGGSGRERACQDVTTVNNLYVTGQLTETSKLPDKDWTTVSPGDVNFPVSCGCDWTNRQNPKPEWKAWDYTDFGN
jgi:hypothetical protein